MARRSGDERERIEAEVRRAIERHALLPEAGRVVVAVSGGADSLCLLGTLDALCGPGKLWPQVELVVAHLDHGLRGEDAAADAAWVNAFAAQLGVRCRLGKAAVAPRALEGTTSGAAGAWRGVEDAARRARYAFLRDVARAEEATRICVGHTADDQAETLILNWLRGSGLTGLTGMRPFAHGIARPLLGLRRGETHAYCAARGWTPRLDPTNTDQRFVRNRIRHSLIPVLKQFNANLVPTLVRNAELLAEDESYLEATAADALEEMTGQVTDNEVTLDTTLLAALPAALRRRVLRQAAALLKGNAYNLDARHIALVSALIAVHANGSAVELPGGIVAIAATERLTLRRRAPRVFAPANHTQMSEPVPLPIPGSAELVGSGWRIRATVLDANAGALPPGIEPWLHGNETQPERGPAPAAGTATDVGRAHLRAYLDADAAGEPLFVRTWRPGDRFRPLGMVGERKLQDYFVDAKVPRDERLRIPLVWGPRHLLWVAGHRLDDRVRLTNQTSRVLALRLELLSGDDEPADGADGTDIPATLNTVDNEDSGRGSSAPGAAEGEDTGEHDA